MASTDDVRNRFIQELIGSAAMLTSIESAAMAEAWASGAVAEWLALGGSDGQLSQRIADASELGAALIDWIEGGDPPQSGPDWVSDTGRHLLLRAMRLVANAKPSEIGWILEYESPSGDRHDLSATIVDGILVGLAVGPEGLALAATEDQSSGFEVHESDAELALSALRECLGRDVAQLSEEAEATLPLLARRLDVRIVITERISSDRTMPERIAEDDRYGADVLVSALRTDLTKPPTDVVREAHTAFSELVDVGDSDAMTLFDVAGLSFAHTVDLDTFVRLVGAYLAPVELDAHSDAQFEALVELEPADWIGVVLGICRAPTGTRVDGDVLVQFINRAPEITTTIPKRDAPRIAWTFEQMLYSWQVTGVLDEEGAVTEAASWLLPRAALAAWGQS